MRMFITDDGLQLHVELELPERSESKYPLVLVLHGFTGHMEERHILAICQAMREAGFATLRAELYGHGQSGGSFGEHTLLKWLNNTLTLIDYARGLPSVRELYLCGHSQGGLTVMLAAAMKHDQISGILPLSPAWMIPEGARQGILLGRRFDPSQIPQSIPIAPGLELNGNYVRAAQLLYPEKVIDRFTGPVLLVHGTADDTVPWESSKLAAEQYENARLVLISGDTHCYDRHLDQVTEAVKSWLAEQTARHGSPRQAE